MKGYHQQWEAVDLDALLESRPREGRQLEYKRELKISTTGDSKEFLADVSAFANSNGGVIVFGMDAEGGEPTELQGICVSDVDAEELRITSLIADNLDPAMRGCHCDFIDHPSGVLALVLRIPPSTSAPHMVKKGSPKFFQRVAGGKTPMDNRDLRNAFLGAGTLETRTRALVSNRCEKILTGDLPVRLQSKGHAVLHIIPRASILNPQFRAIRELHSLSRGLRPPVSAGGWTPGVCLEGIYEASHLGDGTSASYALILREGILEACCPCRDSGDRSGIFYERRYLGAFRDTLAGYHDVVAAVGGLPPFLVSLSLVGCDGTIPHCPPELDDGRRSLPLTEEILTLPMFEADSDSVDWIAVLRHFSDLYANRSGRMQSRYFLEDGTMVRV